MEVMVMLAVVAILIAVNIVITLRKNAGDDRNELKTRLELMNNSLDKLDSQIRNEFNQSRESDQRSAKENREEQAKSIKDLSETLTTTITSLSALQKGQLEGFATKLDELIKSFDEKSRILNEQMNNSAKENRTEQAQSLRQFEESLNNNIQTFITSQKEGFKDLFAKSEQLRTSNDNALKEVRETMSKQLNQLQEANEKKLEEMRKVVDEKLQETVEKRFTESFKLISDRLEQVHKGLGEMQSLASGVGDLKKVLTNVKTRGNLGEIQLGAILEQILSVEQYDMNVAVRNNSQERVEFAIKLPNKNDDKPLLLPIDSKFPNEDYQRLLESYEKSADLPQREMESASKRFEDAIRKNAKDIKEKYINPPVTTDFAIMFVPTEGLYAEILRRPGLFDTLQRDYRITVVGPTNLVAFLSSLQMGFRTLAIEKRSSEVWEILGAVKTEFGNFGTVLERTKKKLQEATNVIDQAGVRSRAIERKLRTVQELPQEESIALLGESIDLENDGEE